MVAVSNLELVTLETDIPSTGTPSPGIPSTGIQIEADTDTVCRLDSKSDVLVWQILVSLSYLATRTMTIN